jgi:hypothetical protein
MLYPETVLWGYLAANLPPAVEISLAPTLQFVLHKGRSYKVASSRDCHRLFYDQVER